MSLEAMLKTSWKRLRERALDQRGALLAEAVVAIVVFTLIGGAVLAGVSTTQRAASSIETSAIAENIARRQMETVLAQPYPDPPPSLANPVLYDPILPPGSYEVTAEATVFPPGDAGHEDPELIVLVTVTVTRGGEPVFTLRTLRLGGS